ncbi:MAG: phosphotransferase [Chloroflexi bacterium]|nr:phosphotransferase [Chloroflexota bacterium]
MERASPVLRRLRREPGPVVVHGGTVMRAGAAIEHLAINVPAGGWTQAAHLEPMAADALLMGSLPGAPIRLRAFYVDARITVSIHRVPMRRRSTLLRGSKAAERIGASHAFVIPDQIERSRRLSHAWVVEELLAPGRRATRAEWRHVIRDVATGIGELWLRSDSRATSIRRVVPWLSSKELVNLLRAMELEPTDRGRLLRRIDELAASQRELLVGWTHGDPCVSNVLRLGGPRLGLVDWERAGRNPLGLDACRMLAGLDDPTEAIAWIDDQFQPLARGRIAPLREQAAISLLGLMPTWARQGKSWKRAGRGEWYRTRNARRLALLEHLLEI